VKKYTEKGKKYMEKVISVANGDIPRKLPLFYEETKPHENAEQFLYSFSERSMRLTISINFELEV